MNKLITIFLSTIIFFSCTKKNIQPYYKVTLSNNEQLINEEVIANLINRVELTTDRYLIENESNEIILFFEQEYDKNLIRTYVLNNLKLEFWHTFKNSEVGNHIYETSNRILTNKLYPGFIDSISKIKSKEIHDDSDIPIYLTDEEIDSMYSISEEDNEMEIFRKTSPLSSYLFPYADRDSHWIESSVLGYAKVTDTTIINKLISDEELLDSISMPNLTFMWEATSLTSTQEGEILINLVMVKKYRYQKSILNRNYIVNAKPGIDAYYDKPMVTLTFDKKGSLIWADMTEQSAYNETGIAICVNDKVVTAPVASSKIEGGITQITGGSFNGDNGINYAENLAFLINLDPLPKTLVIKSIETIDTNAN